MEKGYVSDAMRAGRVIGNRELTTEELGSVFKISDGGVLFSILVIPKAKITDGLISTPDNVGIMVSCKLYQDDANAEFPVYFNQWSEGLIKEIAAGAISSTTYRVFIGGSTNVNAEES